MHGIEDRWVSKAGTDCVIITGGQLGRQTPNSTPPSAAASPAPVVNPGSVPALNSHPASGCSTPVSFGSSAVGSPASVTSAHGPGTPGSVPLPTAAPATGGQMAQALGEGGNAMASHISSPATPATNMME